MTIRCALFFAIGGLASSSVAAPQVTAAPQIKQVKVAVSDPMMLLPASSRHVFRAPPPGWTKKVNYLHLQDNKVAFVMLGTAEQPNLKTDWRQISYFDNPREKDSNNFRKSLRFRPDGSLALEIARTPTEGFYRRFARDGTVVSYEHLRGYKRVAA